MRYDTPYAPIKWPQERLEIPPWWGTLPEIDNLNRRWVKRDFFCITGTVGVPIGGGLSAGSDVVTNEPVPDYGDFWCSSISVAALDNIGESITINDNARVSIRDTRNDYGLFYPYVRTPYLTQPGPGRAVNLMDPYCFTRNSAIEIRFSLDPRAAPLLDRTYFYSLAGWLEYENASTDRR